jgi:micrococcal nuclease
MTPTMVQVQYLYNYDGDTVAVVAEGRKTKVRIEKIDTAEIKGKKPCEKEMAISAKQFVEDQLKRAKNLRLVNNSGNDIYGRTLADIEVDGKSLRDQLLNENLAVPYVPKRRAKTNWCEVKSKREKK